MSMDVTEAVRELLATNLSPSPDGPLQRNSAVYRVAARLGQTTLTLHLALLSCHHYCCMESGCHLPFSTDRRWDRLRSALVAHGAKAPPRMRLRLELVVERGAFLFDPGRPVPGVRGWYAFRPCDYQRYQLTVREHSE